MQSPLSYNTDYPYAEFCFAPAEAVLSSDSTMTVDSASELVLHRILPSGYTMLETKKNYQWSAVEPTALSIGPTVTGWPGRTATAFVDTGGGPMSLTDTNGYIYNKTWPHTVACPAWSSSSTSCTSVCDSLSLILKSEGSDATYSFTADTSQLPPGANGLSLVACQENRYMMGQYGMNIGGFSALFNLILFDYATGRIGFKSKRT